MPCNEASFSLRKDCVYTEDAIQTNYAPDPGSTPVPSQQSGLSLQGSLAGNISLVIHGTLHQSTLELAGRLLGSLDNIRSVSAEFFTGTHQRLPTLSKLRFYHNLNSFATEPDAIFAALCLSILLVQQMPSGNAEDMQSPLYMTVKHLLSSLEVFSDPSIDLLHSKILVAFYELGHGIDRAAYLSIASCARTARVLGLHRKTWRNVAVSSNKVILEEEKRTWWAIVSMDRFLGLCNGDALFATEDPERTDPIPVEDLVWSEGSAADLESLISSPPSLQTSFNITVGQMARECQISHLAGRVVRHVFEPTPDAGFNTEEATQLERTLKAYLPLLADEELRIGKYCGAFGVCNSSLFTLYEFMLSRLPEGAEERQVIWKSIEETSIRALTFSYASYMDREVNYPPEILSPYLPRSLCHAAIVQHRLWKQRGDEECKKRMESLKDILREFTSRWTVARRFLELIDTLDDSQSWISFPFQGSFVSTGKSSIY
ncbi:hypothetical protein GQ53DRAFT_814687 [Thozetella sp. PMI_491]|nr:hypothetical protein GQ53DRAFT_814687 [Thozetella sp. PMI_491]